MVDMFIKFIMIIVLLNVSFSKLKFDFFEKMENKLQFKFIKPLYIFSGICAIIFALRRNNWLPFLNETVLPSSLIPLKENKGDTTITINTEPNTKIIYWASNPSTNILNVEDAYGNYSNSGVVIADKNGLAKLEINKGTGYLVPSGKYIKPHLHYREFLNEYGMLGEVKTVYI